MPGTELLDFMRKAKDASEKLFTSLSNECIHIIMGNESCDLDSVISALCLGLLLDNPEKIFIPLLNIKNEEFALRTEVTHLLRENGVPANLLIFRDQVDLAALCDSGRLRLTLVDHHALPERDRALATCLVAVLDHRPLDEEASRAFPAGTDQDVRTVGSCASLVAERILRQAPHLLDVQVANLIRGTVLLDTACFSVQADRTTPVDVAAVEACENVSNNTQDRATTFDRIVSARKDVSSLTSFQILHKDMKVVRGVPLPGMPLLVQDFLQRPDAGSALSEFCTKHGSAAAVVIGMSFPESSSGSPSLRRDLAVYSHGGEEQPATQLIETLRGEDALQLSPLPCSIPGVTLFDQRNAKLSRKQILPLVQRVLSGSSAS